MFFYIIRYLTKKGSVADFVTALEWHCPIQKDDVLILVNKTPYLSENEEGVVPEEIREQVAWKVDNIVHFPNCTLKGGPTTILVSPTERPVGV